MMTEEKGSPTEFFGTERQNISTENLDTPPSPLIHNFYRFQNLCEIQNGSPTKFFGTVRQSFFEGIS